MSQLRKFACCTYMMSAIWLSGCSGSDSVEAMQEQPANQEQGGPSEDDGNAGGENWLGPEGNSGVTLGERQFALKSALGDIWGPGGDHYHVDFTLTNGKFLIAPTEIDGVTHSLLVPVKASATIYAELYSPGDAFAFGTYSFSPAGVSGSSLAGNAFFDSAYVGVDTDDSGDIESDENFRVIGGTFEFEGVLPKIELNFSVTLENGQMAEGHYTGLFDFANRI